MVPLFYHLLLEYRKCISPMIEKIKKSFITIKNSPIGQFFMRIISWFQENVIKRKLIIFSLLMTIWVGLLLSARLSPERQTYTDEQLKTKQLFSNESGEIDLISQSYSPDTGVIVLQFETTDATSDINRGIETERLHWQLYSKQKTLNTTMDVVPIIDKKISVIIRNVPKNFEAFAIDVTNKTVVVNDVDVDLDTTPSSAKDNKKSRNSSSSTVQFFVAKENTDLKIKSIKKTTREEFTLSEIKQELTFQKDQKVKLQSSIRKLKDSIHDDENTKSNLNNEAKYLSGDDLVQNQSDIETIENNMESKNQSIEIATQNIEKVKEKVKSLKKKENAVKDGTFEFSSSIVTIQKD